MALAVSRFEGSSYEEKDPLASLLLQSERPQVALGLQKHFQINQHEVHSIVCQNWSSKLYPISIHESLYVTRIFELLFHSFQTTQALVGNL